MLGVDDDCLQRRRGPAGDRAGELDHPDIADLVLVEEQGLQRPQRPTGDCARESAYASVADLVVVEVQGQQRPERPTGDFVKYTSQNFILFSRSLRSLKANFTLPLPFTAICFYCLR